MGTEHTVLFSADTIAENVNELAARIDADHGDDGLVVIVVLKGAAIFAADLVRAMKTPSSHISRPRRTSTGSLQENH